MTQQWFPLFRFPSLIKQLTRHEGLRLKVYDDATGKMLRKGDTLIGNPTVGVGRNLIGNGITRDESDFLLENDCKKYLKLLNKNKYLHKVSRGLDFYRRQVILNMAFNLGVHGLSHFREFLGAVETRRFERAANLMLKTKWAKQVGMGKPSRRRPYGGRAWELAEMMRTGQQPTPYKPKSKRKIKS